MALPTTHAIARGVGKFRSSRVLGLTGAFILVYAAWTASLNTVVARLRATDGLGITYGVTLPVSGPQATGVLAASTVVGAAVLVLLVRSFARDTAVLGGGGGAVDTLVAVARGVTVVVLGTLGALVGFGLLLFPGVVVLAHLPLALVAVAADDASLSRGVALAWTRADGHRFRLGGLVLGVVVLVGGIGVVGATTTLVPTVVEFALGVLLTGTILVAGVAVSTTFARGLDKPAPSRPAPRSDSRAL
ncbi:MAG: hypothetical protein ABEJ78_00945 [Haloferacaceae archaeon]